MLILGIMNDMWMYDISDNTWTHQSGSMKLSTPADYDVPFPGGMYDHSMSYFDDHLYVFGGYGQTETTDGLFY